VEKVKGSLLWPEIVGNEREKSKLKRKEKKRKEKDINMKTKKSTKAEPNDPPRLYIIKG
jgi:hypothetical protein